MAVREQTSSFEPKPFGRYVLLEKLAVGGMAEIYKAKTYGVDGFEKQLAIKRILPHCAADNEFIRMLVDEAKLTVLLSHANIVQVYDLGKVGDDYFISMEFISGTNLREVVTRLRDSQEKIPEEIAVYVMSEVCKGLDYAHRKTDTQGNPLNIVHRDISPQNILISFEGEVKIVDFGIAKAAMNVSHTMAGILKGKVAYMSPEQALGKPIDHRTDIFSAGVLLYEMLTGDKLFSGETQFEVLNQIRTTRINTLMLPDHIPGPLKAILAKALAYNAKDRYQTAGDFQLDLTKFLYSSYIDFSPRQLAALLSKLFESEMKRKEMPVQIDEKTRSVLINQAAAESIVVHSPAKVAEKASEPPPPNTSVSGLYAAPTERKKSNKAVLAGGAVILTLLVGYMGYRYGLKPLLHKRPPVTTPTTPTNPEEENPVELGSIQADSTPPGAKVFVNGNDTGLVTPTTIAKLNVGEEYQVKLQKENYRDVSKTVAVTSPEEAVKIQETLSPLPKGSIDIDSSPRGAKIAVNGNDTGLVTPMRVENLEIQKSYQVKLSYPNYYEWNGNVDVKDFDPVKLQAMLNPVPPPTPTTPPVQTPPVPTTPPVQTPPTTPTTPVVTTPPVQTPQTPPVPTTPPVQTPPTTPTTPIVTTPPIQTPTTPPIPTTTYGKLTITSDPSGARILLNGSNTGRVTPATLDRLEAGKRVTIGLQRKGYTDWSRTIGIETNKSTPLYAALKKEESEAPIPIPPSTPPPVKEKPTPLEERTTSTGGTPATLSISSDPSGAEVYVNSEFKGNTPVRVANLSPGTVRVSVSKDGYMKTTTSVRLAPGEMKSLGTIKLGGMYGEISINSMPARANVIFDGESIGARTPVTIRRVPRDKTHSLRIRLDGYREWETSVNLSEQDSKKFDVQLEKN